MLTALHVEGRTPLHRLGARAKLVGLAALGIGLFLVASPLLLGVAAAIAASLYLSIGIRPGMALHRVAPTLWSLAFLTAINVFLLPVHEVLVIALRLLVLILAAAAVTATTPLPDMMHAIERLLRPLVRLGWLRAGDAGLALGLCMRFVPEVTARYSALAQAHRARGLAVRPLTLLGPLVILTLRQADDIAAAIDARGLRTAPSRESRRRQKRP